MSFWKSWRIPIARGLTCQPAAKEAASAGHFSGCRERALRQFFLAAIALALLAVSTAAGARAESITLKVGYTDQESPFFMMGHGRDIPLLPGISIEIARMAAEKCDVDLTIERYPGGRLLALLKENAIDSVLMLSFSPERLAIAAYPMAGERADRDLQLATLSYFFYARRGSDIGWDGKTLTGQTQPVGANLGWSVVDDLRKLGIEVEAAQETRNNFSKLMLDRIDAFAVQNSIGDAYVAAHGLAANVTRLEPPISSKEYYQVFSRAWHAAHPDSAQCLWQETARIRTAEMPAMLARYHDSM